MTAPQYQIHQIKSLIEIGRILAKLFWHAKRRGERRLAREYRKSWARLQECSRLQNAWRN